MSQVLINKIREKFVSQKKFPEFRSGYTVKVYQKVKEGEKERLQTFEGLVIKVNAGYATDASFKVRKIVEGIGVEKTFPMCSPLIDKIEVIKKAKVRKSKLYYMRDLSGKAARLKETWLKKSNTEIKADAAAAKAEEEKVASAVVAEEVEPMVENTEVVKDQVTEEEVKE